MSFRDKDHLCNIISWFFLCFFSNYSWFYSLFSWSGRFIFWFIPRCALLFRLLLLTAQMQWKRFNVSTVGVMLFWISAEAAWTAGWDFIQQFNLEDFWQDGEGFQQENLDSTESCCLYWIIHDHKIRMRCISTRK